jgi:AcrR family transcriptional regulator
MIVKTHPYGRPPGRKAEQSEATRRRLLAVARELFAERGYAGTATEEVVQRAGVTRGALYHQFRDKEDLFRAVYEEVERELAERIVSGLRSRITAEADAWEQIRAGNEAFLDACLDPAVQRIALLDAPAVVDATSRRDINQYGLRLIRRGLEMAIEQGLIEPQPIEPTAHLVRAVLNEAALLLARSPDPAAARAEIGAAVDRLFSGLRRPTR